MSREVEPGNYSWRRQPYRGRPEPKYINRGKRFRNLLAENRERAKTIWVLGILDFLVLIGLIFSYDPDNNIIFAVLFIVAMILLVLTVAIVQGTKNIDKFRPGYDVDVSAEKDHEQEEDAQ